MIRGVSVGDYPDVQWSDGQERSDKYEGDSLSRAIIAYFAEKREDKLLELKWENECFRRILRENTPENAPKAAAAAGGRA